MAEPIYHATNIFPTDGVKTEWDFSFDGVSPDAGSGTVPYLFAADVKAQEIYESAGESVTVQRDVQIVAPTRIRVLGAPIAAGRKVRIYRETEVRFPLVDYRDRQVVTEADLDLSARQTVFVAAEVTDLALSALGTANAALSEAESATAIAENAKAIAEDAAIRADAAEEAGNAATGAANAATSAAAAALLAAQAAEAHAASADSSAATALSTANSANTTANNAAALATTASNNATSALTVANAIDGKAQTALNTANNAQTVANAIDGKAQTAIDTANAANAKADNALGTANGIDAKATLAITTANHAETVAQQALDQISTSGVLKFNGRIGNVLPTSGDYTATQITTGATTVEARLASLISSGHIGTIGTLAESALNGTDIPSGRYACIAAGLGILPINVNSYVEVYDNASAGFARQRISPVTGNREFTRNCVAGGWTAYTEVVPSGGFFVANKAALRAVLKGSAVSVATMGDTVAGDGGGGEYYYDAADTTSADNGGSILVATDGGRWKLADVTLATVATFGGKADNSTDNTPVVQRMLSAGLRVITYGPGTWLHRSAIIIPQGVNLTVRGAGFRVTTVAATAATGFATYSYTRTLGQSGSVSVFEDIQFLWSGTPRLAASNAIRYYGASDAQSDNWFRTERCAFLNYDIARDSKWAGQCYSTKDFYQGNRYDNRLLRGCSFWYFEACMSFSPTFILASDPVRDAFSNGLFIDKCHNITATSECLNIDGWQAVFVDSCGFDLGSGGAAALYFAFCQDVYVSKCFISSNAVADRRGVQFVESHSAAVTHCTLVNNRCAIQISAPAGRSTKVVIDGNKFENNRDNDVLLLDNSYANKIINNHFQTVPSRTGTNFEVYANTFGTNGNIITQNTFAGPGYTILTGAYSIIENNLYNIAP